MAKSELSYFEERFKESENKIGISLSLCRKNISTMLSLMPRTGFFRTYTDHSINHCVSMFEILTWLIPDEIKKRLSDTECSLLVLSVYLHDLGMLATQDEFENRSKNPDFIKFEQEYVFDFNTKAPISADHPTKDHFIFEEFIRHTHADRIFNWMQNEFASLPQEIELKTLFHSASESLRYYLALLCKSHHLNNLHDTTLYPTEFHFGTDSANIQFLAICLRLADILHLTSDRTPPIEFRTLSPKNPVSAREWAKQIQVSGIGISKTNSNIINIDAICKDHRAFFYLRDFITVINKELQQCQTWLDLPSGVISQKYFLKVNSVTDEGLKAIGFIAERFSLQIDHKRTIELLMGNNLYGDNKVVIRELIQNSIDAVKVRLLETEKLKPKIRVELDNVNRTLKITDNGIGMDLDVLRQHFLRVGDSYYRSKNFKKRCPNYTPISQFGIGFLTSFMIADKVEVITKSCKVPSKILKLVLEDIYDLFAVTELESLDTPSKIISTGGTIIKLFLREGIKFDNFIAEVAKWIVYLDFSIEVVIDANPATSITGIQGSTPDEIGKDIISRFSDDYTEYCPIVIENKDVVITILWEGNKFGDDYLLAPAGRLLLPLSRSMHYYGRGDKERDMMRRREKSDIRKVANGGIFLSDFLPGFKLSDKLRGTNFHYIIDCRGETRFTPLVSRAGIAVDSSSIEILSFFIVGLTEYISSNVISLLNKNVSKYFCSYYAGSALGMLFDRRAMDSEVEQILSFMMAMIHAQNVPLALIKTGDEFLLKKWKDQLGKEVVVGRNVYDSLLKSVTYGSVEFPLPKEVLDSLPENYLITQGIENVILPMFWYTKYEPVEVKYDETCKGIFIVCKPVENNSLEYFAGDVVLDFPANLNEHGFIEFDMAKCWNKNHSGFQIIKRISNDILTEKPENKLKEIEKFLKQNLLRERFLFRMTEKEIKDTRKDYKERIFREFNLTIDLTLNEVKELLNFNSLQEYLWRWDSY